MRATILLTLAVAGCQGAGAQDSATSAHEEAIRNSVDSYVEAFNSGDSDRLASHWSENGVYTNRTTGERLTGRENIRASFEQLLADAEGERLEVTVESVRFVTPDVAIEEGTAHFIEPGAPPSPSTYAAIHVNRDGEWLLDSVRETVVPAAETSSHYEHLKDLEWMVGRWIDQGDGATIETVCQWTANRNFLTRSFTVSIDDRIDMRGTQVIGWDPVDEQVRSWVFDTEGGFTEGVWTKQDDRWIIKMRGVLAGGRESAGIHVITFVDNDTFTFQSLAREVDGELLPNIEEVTVVRAPAGS